MTRKSRTLLIRLIVVIALAVIAWYWTAQQSVGEFIRIGTWNIQFLGVPNSRSGPARGVDQKPDDLADYIMQSQVDILGLEEVSDNDGEADSYANKTIAAALAIINRKTGDEWRHVLFPNPVRPADGASQLCGIAWNAGKVRQVGEAYKIPVTSPDESAWRRHPHAVKFSLGPDLTDIVVIVVHMKSNYGGAPAARIVRHDEAKSLMQKLADITSHFNDSDIIIMGDTNVLKHTEKTVEDFKSFGFRDLNEADQRTFHSGAPFDRFFVPSDQPEFADAEQETFDEVYLESRGLSMEDFRRDYSDHFLIRSNVRIMPDDDP